MCWQCRINCKLGLISEPVECTDDKLSKPAYLLVRAVLSARRVPMDIVKYIILPFLPDYPEEAAIDGDAYLLECLLFDEYQCRKTRCLIMASAFGRIEAVKAALQSGARVNDSWFAPHIFSDPSLNMIDQFYHSALPIAIWNKQIAVAQVLLDAKADVNIDEGQSLWLAIICGNCDLVDLLLTANANVHERNDMALRTSIHCGSLPIINKLLEHGADVHTYNDEILIYCVGWTPSSTLTPVVQRLLDANANVHAGNEAMLVEAIQDRNEPLVQILLNARADIHAVDDPDIQETFFREYNHLSRYV
jgi:hypothetical protein